MHLRAIFGFIAVLFLPAVTLCAGELPPDSAYVQLDEKGHFALDNRRLRFWGAQGGFPFSSDAKNVALVERLKATFEADWKASAKYAAPDPLDPSLHEEGELPPDPHFVHD
jgi:hypothetical protein